MPSTRFLLLFAMTLLVCLPAVVSAQTPDVPILFTKQYNYQGLHIYDAFYQWRPGGGIYILENPADPPEKHRIRPVIDATTPETLGEGIYFDTSLSYNAKKVLFSFKGSPNGNSTIYEIGVDGRGLRQITNLDKNGNPYKGAGGGHHDVSPCYLPDDRIVFCSTRYSGLVPCANNGVAILHVMNNDGSDIHTISVNNVTEFDPAVLPDGRILFGRWEYIDKNALTIQSVWTVSPDGTNETALYANNMVFPEAVLQAKPVAGNEHLIVATFAPHNAPPRGTIAMIDTRLGKNDEKAIFNFEHPDRPTFDRGESCDPWALSENLVLFSGIPDAADAPKIGNDTPAGARSNAKLNAILLIDRSGKKTTVLSDPRFDLRRPIPLVPREKPPQIADQTDRTKIEGDFFVSNVYDGMSEVPHGTVKWLRVIEETSRVSESPGGSWMNQTFSISAALAWSPKIYHGIVPVEEDGSVYFTAPSGRSLSFQLLDEDYRLVRGMRTFIQAAPGTTRSCVGCHEYKYGAAPNANMSPSLNRKPRRLQDESWGSGYLDYAKMVQPVLDAKCVSCHGGEGGFAAGLDLSGSPTELFNISYENLTARREKQYIADLIQGICCMNGTAYWSCKIFGPYEHGTGNAPLAEQLLVEPHASDAGLTQAERELLFTWVDSNAIYFGTWDYTQTGAYCREYTAAKQELVGVMRENSCVECHADASGNIKRFDDWINLNDPKMSRILRAPLDPDAKDGFGVALCRGRKVNQEFSRLGLMFKSGYEHAVRNLEDFPTQKWQPWDVSLEGKPVISFASTHDPVYQKMLAVIEKASIRQSQNPRVDMPFADEIGKGVTPGRSRQIIPQPLPETPPKLEIRADADGIVRLSWERSARTIGLVAEVHRSLERSNFTLTDKTLLSKTERFEYADRDAPLGKTAYYAVVFVSDPAVTCGTMKSGAVLSYGDFRQVSFVPEIGSIESRCPLSDFEPLRARPVRAGVAVPVPKKPPLPEFFEAEAKPGQITLYWKSQNPAAYRYLVFEKKQGGTLVPLCDEPLEAGFFDVTTEDDAKHEYAVRTVGRGGQSANVATVKVKAQKVRQEPVLVFDESSGKSTAPASVSGSTVDLSQGGHVTVPANNDYSAGPAFSVELDVTFSEPGEMPIVISNGTWNGAGWFLQKLGGRWRFHVGGVDCDGGTPPTGQKMHMLGTYDGTTVRLYQDGQLVAEKPGAINKAPWSGDLVIGQYSAGIGPAYQFRGTVENVKIYHRVLKP